MSFNGSGTFLINSSGQPVVTGTVISSTVFNALTADLATGLSTTITKDGQTSITANIPWSGYKITSLGAGTAGTDAAQLQQVQGSTAKLITVTGTDSIIGSLSPALTAYAAGQMFYFVAAGTNTTAVTINIDGLGVKNLTHNGNVALAAGDILSGEVVVIVYDGTRFQMVSPANSFGSIILGSPLAVSYGGTGVSTLTGYAKGSGTSAFSAVATIPVADGGTGQTSYTNGELLIGNTTGNTLTKTTLTAGANILITNGAGSITIAATSGAQDYIVQSYGIV